MNSLDLKYYFSVFLRRLPYLMVILAFVSAIGLTVAFILPPSYQSTARMLVEPAQIPEISPSRRCRSTRSSRSRSSSSVL